MCWRDVAAERRQGESVSKMLEDSRKRSRWCLKFCCGDVFKVCFLVVLRAVLFFCFSRFLRFGFSLVRCECVKAERQVRLCHLFKLNFV